MNRAIVQRGSALLMALVLLMITSLGASTLMRQAFGTERVAWGARGQLQAQQAAELALRYCERVPFEREGNARVAAVARPDVLVRVPPPKVNPADTPRRPGCKKTTGCVCERENLGEQCIWRL